MFTRTFLCEVRLKALRRGIWLRVLDDLERGIFDLVCHVVERVRSTTLGCVLVKIVDRLKDVLKNGFVKMFELFGLKRAVELACLASGWGYGDVSAWTNNQKYARYITVMEYNDPFVRL